MRGPLLEYLRSVLLDASILRSGLFDRAAIERAIEQHVTGRKDDGNLLYRLLTLALWYRGYVNTD